VAKRRSRGITGDSDRPDRRLVISSTFSTLPPSLGPARFESSTRTIKPPVYGAGAERVHDSYISAAPRGSRNRRDYHAVMPRAPFREYRFADAARSASMRLGRLANASAASRFIPLFPMHDDVTRSLRDCYVI